MGKVHARAYSKMPDVQLVGGFDSHSERLAAFSQEFGAEASPSMDSLLASVDVVDVCVPTHRHAEYALSAIEAEKAVVCEKPMARTIAECETICEAAARKGTTFMPAQVLRFFPEFKKAQEMVASGSVGNVATVRTRRGGDFPRAAADWYADFEKSGGAMLDLIIHDFDWIRWTFGPIQRVFARAITFDGYDHLDYALVMMKTQSGAIVHTEGIWCEPTGFRVAFEICGDRGMLEYDSGKSAPLITAVREEAGSIAGVSIPESPSNTDPYFDELRHFIDCVQSGASPDVSAQDGLEAVRISLAAIESVKTGRAVYL